MKDHAFSLYESIDGSELETARAVRFGEGFYEYGGPRQGQAWKIHHCLPTGAEAYCALVLPWCAYLEGTSGWRRVRDDPFEGIAEAYQYLGMPVPRQLNLDSWHADFRIMEDIRVLPPLAREALDRFSHRSVYRNASTFWDHGNISARRAMVSASSR